MKNNALWVKVIDCFSEDKSISPFTIAKKITEDDSGKTRGRFFVCQSPITVDKEYIYQDGVYTR